MSLADFNALELFFLVCATVGGAFVLIKLILQFAGGDADTDAGGADLDLDMGASADGIHHADSDAGFRLLSMYGLSAFFMMFGLVGLALYRQSELGEVLSVLGACVAGYGSAWFIGKIFQSASTLQSSGTLGVRDALGCKGTVYMKIPAQGVGRVNVSVQGRLREYDAVSKNGTELATGTAVKVLDANATTLVVDATS